MSHFYLQGFHDVDIMKSLQEIAEKNTAFYQTDFLVDKEILKQAEESTSLDDKNLIWISREKGTHCFNERNSFIADTPEYNKFMFYKNNTDVLAFSVEIKEMQDNVIKGNIYEINYLPQSLFRQKNCSLLESVAVTFENGNKEVFSSEEYFQNIAQLQQKYGQIKEVHYEATKRVLETLQKQKEATQRGDIKQYIQKLENKSVSFEKETVSPSFQNIKKPSIQQQLQKNRQQKQKNVEQKTQYKNNIKREEAR
ncbi:DUF1708 domain-containing protein [Clostridium sp. MD294]|uniref:DUF1708 domain-containing protein n=1 Tax=Clostridium sp. MD294 TaxID=97138 RepID=UPI0002CCC0EB|nr:DUF1708 domain-containing protein [Clostridium sp. MD294]NDO47846.1 hypothetical protein [Clostridium sp. MD294]USF29832.1 hypothetical protein C820_001240 [Clostridium sp. MD294]